MEKWRCKVCGYIHKGNEPPERCEFIDATCYSPDCVGLYCPLPISKTKEKIDKIEVRQILKIEADDPTAEEEMKNENSILYVQTSDELESSILL